MDRMWGVYSWGLQKEKKSAMIIGKFGIILTVYYDV